MKSQLFTVGRLIDLRTTKGSPNAETGHTDGREPACSMRAPSGIGGRSWRYWKGSGNHGNEDSAQLNLNPGRNSPEIAAFGDSAATNGARFEESETNSSKDEKEWLPQLPIRKETGSVFDPSELSIEKDSRENRLGGECIQIQI